MPDSDKPFYLRGLDAGSGLGAGLFSSYGEYGKGYTNVSFRTILCPNTLI